MTPKQYKQMMDYLTRSGIKDKVKFASDIARPDPKPVVKEIKLFNEFNRRNPKADGGMLVKPSADGSRPGYANPKGNPEFGKTITGARFKDTIRPQNLEKLKKLKQVIIESNSKYKKSLTSKAALEAAGFKQGYQAIGTTGKLREEVKKEIGKLLTTQQKIDNYVNNVMFAEDALVKDFKNPLTHIANKFGVSRGTLRNWAKNSQVYQDNKSIFVGLSRELNYNKYKFIGADNTPRLMSDYSVIMQNKLPSSASLIRGDSAEKFILQSAYRHFKQSKEAGKAAKVTFIGDPDLLPFNEWKFIKGGKLYSVDPAIDTLEFQGKTYTNNYLNRIDGKDIYKNDFGEIYKIFDDLETYMNSTTTVGNKDVKLDTILRKKLYDATGKKDYLLRRAVDIDHFSSVLNEPFKNLRLLDRRTNQLSGLIKRQSKYKNNPKLLNKVLTDIGYTTPYKDVNTFIKRTTRNIDTPIKIIGNQRLRPPVSRPGQGGFIATELIPGVTRGSRRVIGGAAGFVLPEVLFYQLDKKNRMSKGVSEEEAEAGALQSATLGALKDPTYMKNLKKVGESMGVDSRSFDAAYDMNVLLKNYDQNNLNFQDQYLNLLEAGEEKRADDLKKNFDRYAKETQNKYALLANNISDNVMNTVGASPMAISRGREKITQEQFEKPFLDMQKVALEKLKREKIKASPIQKRQVDTTAGSIGEGFYQAFDSLTQGAKNLLQGRVVPFASKIGFPQYEPQASQRKILSDTLQNLSDRDLERFNLGRGYVQSDPVSDLDIQNLRFERPGAFFAGGGIAKTAGVSSGPPPEKGPNSQGLPGLLKRVRNI